MNRRVLLIGSAGIVAAGAGITTALWRRAALDTAAETAIVWSLSGSSASTSKQRSVQPCVPSRSPRSMHSWARLL